VLGITINTKGVHWGCSHCGWTGGAYYKSNGRAGENLITYDYDDESGVLRFQKVRAPGKKFWQRRPDGNGGWIKNLNGVRKMLYRLPELNKDITAGNRIVIAEGERDVNNLRAIGVPATCNPDGAAKPGQKPKWRPEFSETLRGADIVVIPDHDDAGYAHAKAIISMSAGIAKSVHVLRLADHWPDCPVGGDISDWLAKDHTREELDALLDRAQAQAQPRDDSNNGDDADSNNGDDADSNNGDDAEIDRLAKLEAFEYERARKAAAEKLNVRASILDRLVNIRRDELGLNGDDKRQGHAISFPEPEPWPDPVDGAALLNALSEAVGKHVVMEKSASHIGSPWVVHTYLLDVFLITPRLAITSPVRRCGKTTLLDVLARLVYRPLPAANVSAAAVFRVIEGHRPCLLIDEADTFLAANEELRGVLNSGHRRGGSVLRTVGDDHEPRSFATYGACVIALIGQLPGTLTDRSVEIKLKRRLPSESIEPFRLDRTQHLDILARQCARWAQDNVEAVRAADPEMPAGIFNRDADNLRPLLAIAEVAGGEWLDRVRKAALAGRESGDVDEGSRIELLIRDIHGVFASSKHLNRIASADLVARLVEIEGRPWAEYGRSGKPITQNKLARLLKPLGITPIRARIGNENVHVYERSQFSDVFARFVSPEAGIEPEQWNKRDEMGTSGAFQSGTNEADVPDGKCEKSNNDGICSTVPVAKGESGKEARYRVLGKAPPGERCALCGEGRGVMRLKHADGIDLWHPDCAENYLARMAGTPPVRDELAPQPCAQCHGPVDGKERRYTIDGESVPLHPECEPFYRGSL
jgi:putative DNA primase/helicase